MKIINKTNIPDSIIYKIILNSYSTKNKLQYIYSFEDITGVSNKTYVIETKNYSTIFITDFGDYCEVTTPFRNKN